MGAGFFMPARMKGGLSMDGENDGATAQTQVTGQQASQGDQAAQQQTQQQPTVTGAPQGGETAATGDDALAQARSDYEAALAERDAQIAELEKTIAEAAKTAESAEQLRAEMDELRRQGDEQRMGFELKLAGTRNVKAARALLSDYDNDIEKLKASEPWLFGEVAAAPAQTGAAGLPNAGAATDEGSEMKRWREIAGLEE